MNKFKCALATSCLLTSFNSFATATDETKVDPADLTKVSSSLILGTSTHNDLKVQGSVAGGYDSGNGYMILAEASMNQEGDYTNSRFQYFHTGNTGWSVMPKAALSLDLIDNDMMTSAAVGGLSLITTPWKNLMFFPLAAYVHGELKSDFSNQFGGIDSVVSGGMGAFFTSIRLDEKGTFVTFWPEYTTLTGDAEITSTKYILNAGTPLSEDRSKWMMFKFESIANEVTVNNTSMKTSDKVAWMSFRMFF